MEILKVSDLSFRYASEAKKTLDNVSFSVERGELVTLCGKTGSGKSTLLRLIKREISPRGDREGSVLFEGRDVLDLDAKEAALRIGFVSQYPEEQIVTDKVWHEIAFGLENIGVDREAMQRRVAETAQYFGLSELFDKDVSSLSGGQKQMLALASVMVMDPDVILLDEPTSQLDPISASEFISTLHKLCRELALTVIITEHRLEELLPISDKMIVMNQGRIHSLGAPEEVLHGLKDSGELHGFLPAPTRLFYEISRDASQCPIDIRSGRALLEKLCDNVVRTVQVHTKKRSEKSVIRAKDLCFRYSRELPDVLCGLDLDVREGEFYAILGGNGSGKTTALGALAGINKCYCGRLEILGKRIEKYHGEELYNNCVAMLPQDVHVLFTRDSVRAELADAGVDMTALAPEILELADKHPYDLSGGQMQLVALQMILAKRPKILLLDEPTKGLDADAKSALKTLISDLCLDGVTVVAVTHDVEFAADAADFCALFFKGRIFSKGSARDFFSENKFYTTAIGRMTKGYFDNIVSVGDAIELCKINKRKD